MHLLNYVMFVSSLLFYPTVNGKNFFIDINPILNELDDVIASDSIPSLELLNTCSEALQIASIILPEKSEAVLSNDEYTMCTIKLLLYRIQAEAIVQKLKQLSSKISNNEQGFLRDKFYVNSPTRNAEYFVEAIEFYYEVRYYKHSNKMMKLCEWKVYKLPSSSVDLTDENISEIKFVAQYNLEKSQSEDSTPTYVFGKTNMEDNGHVSIVNYGTKPGPKFDGYYQMKLLLIKDLKSLKGLPVLARTIRNQETGVSTVIVYGLTRRLQEALGLEVDDNILYNDDVVTKYDTETGRMLENSDL